VSLGNVIPASYKDPNIFFISEADKQLLIRHNTESFELQVGLHELLGHGSGKLFRKNPDGSYNFDVDSVKASLGPGEEVRVLKSCSLVFYRILMSLLFSCLGMKKVKRMTQSFLQFHPHTKSAEQNALVFICRSMMMS
jgi:hypothetical protein